GRALVVARLELNADELAAHLQSHDAFAADACERTQDNSAGVGPQIDAALDHLKLQRTDMALVVMLSSASELQRIVRVDVHPYRRCDRLPLVYRVLLRVMRHAVFDLARCAHR